MSELVIEHIFFVYHSSLCLKQAHASYSTFYWIFSILTRSNTLLLAIDQWDRHVYSEAFDRDCNAQSGSLASKYSGSESYERLKLWENDDAFSLTWVDSSDHGVSELEARLYHHGLRSTTYLWSHSP